VVRLRRESYWGQEIRERWSEREIVMEGNIMTLTSKAGFDNLNFRRQREFRK
jgi:hypothetical protein